MHVNLIQTTEDLNKYIVSQNDENEMPTPSTAT